jgi:hypothetical protein
MAFTPMLNISLSDSPPDKLTLISLAGSGFEYDGHETNRLQNQYMHSRRAMNCAPKHVENNRLHPLWAPLLCLIIERRWRDVRDATTLNQTSSETTDRARGRNNERSLSWSTAAFSESTRFVMYAILS